MQHTYGYLFSLIETPYGPERRRWLSQEWEQGFRLAPSLLGPLPNDGTLLANLTWFLGQIVFRQEICLAKRLQRIEPAVVAELVRYDFRRLNVCRIVEEVTLGQKVPRRVRILTDLVPLPHPVHSEIMSAVLMYSIQNGSTAPLKLITAFPIRDQVERNLKASVRPGSVPVRTAL